MSTHLCIEEVSPIEVGLILPDVNRVLRLILGLCFDFELAPVEMYEPEKVLLGTYLINPGTEDIFGIMITGEPGIVSVTTIVGAKHVCISPDYGRTGLNYALAAAVAIALAESSGRLIADDSGAYTKVFRQPADEFIRTIKVDGTYWNISEAARAFFADQLQRQQGD